MSSKIEDETDSRIHLRRDRLASEPAFVPRDATCLNNAMAVQSGMLMELNSTDPHVEPQ